MISWFGTADQRRTSRFEQDVDPLDWTFEAVPVCILKTERYLGLLCYYGLFSLVLLPDQQLLRRGGSRSASQPL